MGKITTYPSVVTSADTDIYVVVQGGVTKKVTRLNLLASTKAAYEAADLILTNDISNLQTTKANIASPTFTGVPAAPTASAGTSTTQLATTAFVTTADLLRLRLSGVDTMTGNLQMGANKITGIADGTVSTDATSLGQVNTALALKATKLSNYNPTITSAFPVTGLYGSIKAGDRFFITSDGTVASGTISLKTGDIIEAKIDGASNTSTDWAYKNGSITSISGSGPINVTGGATPVISLTAVPYTLGGTGQVSLGLGGQVLRTNPSATGTEWFTLTGGGSVTSVTSTVGDGVTINITNPSTTPNLTVDLGAITPTSVNGLIITPTSYTLNVPANATVYGINTGDQLNVIGNSGSTSTVAISDDTSTNADHYLSFYSATSGNQLAEVSSTRFIVNPSNGWMGLRGSPTLGQLDLWYNGYSSGKASLVIGADKTSTDLYTRTDATAKIGTIAFPHYTNAEEPVTLVYGDIGAANSILYIGGGLAQQNSATQIRFYAGATQTTTTGTLMAIISTGGLGINTSSYNAMLEVQGSNTSSATPCFRLKNSTPTNLVSIMNNGYAGFGTASPSAILHLIGEDTTTSNFSLKALNSGGSTGFYVNNAGQIYGTALHNNASAITGTTNQYIASGTYTPIITAVLNLTSSTNSTAIYHRVGNVITVSGYVEVVPSSAAHVIARISLPVASTFTTGFEVNGSATEQTFPYTVAAVNANVTNNDVYLHVNAASTSSHFMSYIYQYEVK